MNDHNSDAAAADAEQAMNRVLAAEREAEQAVGDCESEAQAILQGAQQAALRIDERTNDRIAIIEQRCSQRIERQLRDIRRLGQSEPLVAPDRPPDAADLQALITDLALDLTRSRD